jgi:hypothetical protein
MATTLRTQFVPVDPVHLARMHRFVFRGGRARCLCLPCQLAEGCWPDYYIGSCNLSWECFLERNDLVEERPGSIPDAAAIADRLHKVRRRPPRARKPAPVLIDGCEGCGGLRPKGNRYCLECEQSVRAAMEASRYLS